MGSHDKRGVRDSHRPMTDRWLVDRRPVIVTVRSVTTEEPLEVRLLGPVELGVHGCPVPAGPPQHRLVLAALALDAGRPVGVETLVDRVWDEAPDGARRTLHVAVARLRRTLPDGVLTRRSGGYVLNVAPDAVDALRLRTAVAAAGGDGIERLRDVADAWRAEPLAGLPGRWAARTRAALTQDALHAAVAWARAEIAAGHPEATVARLVALDGEHPLVEPIAATLIRALHAAGRTADALDHYAAVRQRLVEELGADPGPDLRAAQRAVLADDRPPAPPAGPARRPLPAQLPADPGTFCGRDADLERLTGLLTAPSPAAMPLVVVPGLGGVGKTWLALRWAHRHRAAFPDGQLFADLRGYDPAGGPAAATTAVLRGFLDALGVAATAVPAGAAAQAALFRSLVAGRRMLIVLDNARDSAHVTPLLPGSATCAVLVTSRDRLSGLVTAHGAVPVPLAVLEPDAAHAVLARRLDPRRLQAEPRAAADLVATCAGLPLALGIAAARAALEPHVGLAALAAELHDAGRRLDAFDDDRAGGLRAVLAASRSALTAAEARAYALLGLVPGPDIDRAAAAALIGTDPDAVLRGLTRQSLLDRPAATRWRMHDLVRLDAADAAAGLEPADRDAARYRLVTFYLHTAFAGELVMAPSRTPITPVPLPPGVEPAPVPTPREAMAWCADEHDNIAACQQLAADHGWDDAVWQFGWAIGGYHHRTARWHDHARFWAAGLAASERIGTPEAVIRARRLAGTTAAKTGDHDGALTHLRAALDLAVRTGDLVEQARIQHGTGFAWDCHGDAGRALECSREALRLYRLLGDPAGIAAVQNEVGLYCVRLGRHTEAREHLEASLPLIREVNPSSEAAVVDSLGELAHATGRHDEAVARFREALRLVREVGDVFNEAEVLERLGAGEAARGRPGAAREAWTEAAALYAAQGRTDAAARVRALAAS
jgi:DNA-binding SARP family transcriptional activator/tetratricopeptide (TPR) repeat protein